MPQATDISVGPRPGCTGIAQNSARACLSALKEARWQQKHELVHSSRDTRKEGRGRGGGERSADGETWRSARQNGANLTFDSVAPRMAGWPPVQIGPHDRELYRARTSIFRDKRGNPSSSSYIATTSRKREDKHDKTDYRKLNRSF